MQKLYKGVSVPASYPKKTCYETISLQLAYTRQCKSGLIMDGGIGRAAVVAAVECGASQQR